MEDLIIHMAITTLLATIKNPAKVAVFKAALRKVRDVLDAMNLDQ